MYRDNAQAPDRRAGAALALASLLYAVVLTRTAWLDDDAFITLRVADNWVNGFGPRWNVAERVQVVTSPAWLGLVTLARAITGESYYTLLGLSMLVSCAAIAVLARRVAPNRAVAALSVLALACSTSFVEYSTSGLELPLAYLLLSLFCGQLLRGVVTAREVTTLVLLASGIVLTRPDLVLLILPACAVVLWPVLSQRRMRLSVLLGATPFVAWELVSLVYYGALVPNTALAKLATSEPSSARLQSGVAYFDNQWRHDPWSFVVFGLAAVVGFLPRRPALARPLLLGVLLYLLYVVRIGGCFMLGRYFAAPLLVSVAVLAWYAARLRWPVLLAGAVGALIVGSFAPHFPLRTGEDFGRKPDWYVTFGLSDERMFYYQSTGLLPSLRFGRRQPDHPFAGLGHFYRDAPGTHVVAAAGMPGFFAGPRAHLIDLYALTDPLLARLPAMSGARLPAVHVAIGHHARRLPTGYLRSVASGADFFEDRKLAALHQQLLVVTRGPIWSAQRWLAIWKLHTGGYADLVDVQAQRLCCTRRVPLAELREWRSPFGFDALMLDRHAGLHVELPELTHARGLRARVGAGAVYELGFLRGSQLVATTRLFAERHEREATVVVDVDVPAQAITSGYDGIRVRSAVQRAPSAISFLDLLPESSALPPKS